VEQRLAPHSTVGLGRALMVRTQSYRNCLSTFGATIGTMTVGWTMWRRLTPFTPPNERRQVGHAARPALYPVVSISAPCASPSAGFSERSSCQPAPYLRVMRTARCAAFRPAANVRGVQQGLFSAEIGLLKSQSTGKFMAGALAARVAAGVRPACCP